MPLKSGYQVLINTGETKILRPNFPTKVKSIYREFTNEINIGGTKILRPSSPKKKILGKLGLNHLDLFFWAKQTKNVSFCFLILCGQLRL